MFDWITGFVVRSGYSGIFLLMLAENVVPPIPSELIMPLAGFTAARGQLGLAIVILAGTAGSLTGAVFWYYIGKWLGLKRLKHLAARHGRWVTLSPADVERADEWFTRHGAGAVFFGRLIPTVRTLISVPAGIAGMPLPSFLAWSALGTGLWTALLAGAGYLLQSQYELVSDYLNPISTAVVVLIIGWYLYRVATFRTGGRPSTR
ncbi:DedA family protein [Microvirga makkahensis]|uniref:DedA family protein n=1 Tax=Microvirga makkahensis TaxID=1128670 RepID=A0A7X3MP57_9HYPH|nr:DedA family protein [Microvirga makkahensis]MXQ10634.1 DedA family protein [Microvirga makkahensis]